MLVPPEGELESTVTGRAAWAGQSRYSQRGSGSLSAAPNFLRDPHTDSLAYALQSQNHSLKISFVIQYLDHHKLDYIFILVINQEFLVGDMMLELF